MLLCGQTASERIKAAYLYQFLPEVAYEDESPILISQEKINSKSIKSKSKVKISFCFVFVFLSV